MNSEFVIDKHQFSKIIPELAQQLNTDYIEDCDEYILRSENEVFTGEIRGINFPFGLSVLLLDIHPLHDFSFKFDQGRRHPVGFLFCSEGLMQVSGSKNPILRDISGNKSAIFAPEGDSQYFYQFRANVPTQVIIVPVLRYLFLKKIECDLHTLSDPMQAMFKDTTGKLEFYFQADNLPFLTTVLKELFRNKQAGMERKLLIEAKSLELITNSLDMYRNQKRSLLKEFNFSQKDIDNINIAKLMLIENVDAPPTIQKLARTVGMNTSKLQKGFRLLFSKSIRQFVIAYRMHLAQEMMNDNEMSITEIAHKLGYTNKGHFSKLFQAQFGLLPSQYKLRH